MTSGGQEIQARMHLARDNLVTKEEICNMYNNCNYQKCVI